VGAGVDGALVGFVVAEGVDGACVEGASVGLVVAAGVEGAFVGLAFDDEAKVFPVSTDPEKELKMFCKTTTFPDEEVTRMEMGSTTGTAAE